MGQRVAGAAREGRTAQVLRETFAPLGLSPARPDDLAAIHTLSDELIGHGAAEAAVRAIYLRQRFGFYVVREGERVAAAIGFVMLNAAGHAAVRDDTFDPIRPDPAHAVGPDEAPAAVYGWGLAATSRESARALVAGCWAVLDVVPRTFFVRAATEAGERLLVGKIGFRPWPGSTTGLLWLDAAARARRAA